MASVMLHNLCIDTDDPCLPRWRLHVNNISLIREQVEKSEGIIYLMLTTLRLRTGYGTITLERMGGIGLRVCRTDTTNQDTEAQIQEA